MNLYLTADAIGTATGGGIVTKNEVEALRSLGETEVWSFPDAPRPWGADEEAATRLIERPDFVPTLAHIYAGTFSQTVEILKSRGTRITYTAAAHSVGVSLEEHVKLGIPFDYPHLTDPALWTRYVRGYLLADVVVCPSSLSQRIMREYGCMDVRVIPHGVDLPAKVSPLPERFSVAYLGAPGPDKGITYLLQAWKILDYKDATLTIAGRGTENLLGLVRAVGGGNIYLRGEVRDVADVYNGCSLYVQPSASEGFGIEVLEALAHGRPVVCSDGAGAADVAKASCCTVVQMRDAQALADAIRAERNAPSPSTRERVLATQVFAKQYTWDKIRARYVELWTALRGDGAVSSSRPLRAGVGVGLGHVFPCGVCGKLPCPDDHVPDMRNVSLLERIS